MIKSIFASIVLLTASTLGGCSAAGQAKATTIEDTAGVVCEVVLQATDPSLASLCTTAAQVAAAVTALTAAHTTDAGTLAAAAKPYAPTTAEVYAYLQAHGATSVKQ